MKSNYEWLIPAILEIPRTRHSDAKFIIPSFYEYLIASTDALQAEPRGPNLSPQNKFSDTTYASPDIGDKEIVVLLACGNNLLAKFSDHYVRLTLLSLNALTVSCTKCDSLQQVPTLYGCKCSLQVLGQLLSMPDTVRSMDPAMLSFLGSLPPPTLPHPLSQAEGNVSLLLAQQFNAPDNRTISRMIEISGVVYCKYGKATCRIFKEKDSWVTECRCDTFSVSSFCVHIASLPHALRKATVSVYNGNYLHYIFSVIPPEDLVTSVLRYCHAFDCVVLAIKEIAKLKKESRTDDGEINVEWLKQLVVHTPITDDYLRLYSMPDTYIMSLDTESKIGAITFMEPYIVALVRSSVVAVKLNGARDGIELAYCRCSKDDTLWCPHVLAVIRNVANGHAFDYNVLKKELLAIPHSQVINMFLRIIYETSGDLHKGGVFHYSRDVPTEWIEEIQKETLPVGLLDGPIVRLDRKSQKKSGVKSWFLGRDETEKEQPSSELDSYVRKVKEFRVAGDLENAFGLLYKLTEAMSSTRNDVHNLEGEWVSLIEKASLSSEMCLEWSQKLDIFPNLFVEARSLLTYSNSLTLDDSTFLATVIKFLETPETGEFEVKAVHLLGWIRGVRERGKLLEAYLLCIKTLSILVYEEDVGDEVIIQVHELVHSAISEIILAANGAIKDESLLTGIEPLTKISGRIAAQYVFKYYEIKGELDDDLHSLYTTFQPLTHCIPYVLLELIVVSAPVFLQNGSEIFQLAQLFMNIQRPRCALVLGIHSLIYPPYISPDGVLDLCGLILLSNDGSYSKQLVEACEQCELSVVVMFAEKMLGAKRSKVALQLASIAARKCKEGSGLEISSSFLLNLLPVFCEAEDTKLLCELISKVKVSSLLDVLITLDKLGLIRSSIVALEYMSNLRQFSMTVARHFANLLDKCAPGDELDLVTAHLKSMILLTESQELLTHLGDELARIGKNELALLAITKMGLQLCISRTVSSA
eukprot:Phypoly_transcript_01601.p1 GENE.Phypoly_transcript_01601~~Phypoly_transcript_01601.p1  ORF type:complete len:1024 (+),score=85.94 Phypoly_transcript_01601:128-3073(+)